MGAVQVAGGAPGLVQPHQLRQQAGRPLSPAAVAVQLHGAVLRVIRPHQGLAVVLPLHQNGGAHLPVRHVPGGIHPQRPGRRRGVHPRHDFRQPLGESESKAEDVPQGQYRQPQGGPPPYRPAAPGPGGPQLPPHRRPGRNQAAQGQGQQARQQAVGLQNGVPGPPAGPKAPRDGRQQWGQQYGQEHTPPPLPPGLLPPLHLRVGDQGHGGVPRPGDKDVHAPHVGRPLPAPVPAQLLVLRPAPAVEGARLRTHAVGARLPGLHKHRQKAQAHLLQPPALSAQFVEPCLRRLPVGGAVGEAFPQRFHAPPSS